jgi:hypothetical protein
VFEVHPELAVLLDPRVDSALGLAELVEYSQALGIVSTEFAKLLVLVEKSANRGCRAGAKGNDLIRRISETPGSHGLHHSHRHSPAK